MRFGATTVVDVEGGIGGQEGEPSFERGLSRLGREEEVGVEISGTRRLLRDGSRGVAMVDILFCTISRIDLCG